MNVKERCQERSGKELGQVERSNIGSPGSYSRPHTYCPERRASLATRALFGSGGRWGRSAFPRESSSAHGADLWYILLFNALTA